MHSHHDSFDAHAHSPLPHQQDSPHNTPEQQQQRA
jgi:hypothetical protein